VKLSQKEQIEKRSKENEVSKRTNGFDRNVSMAAMQKEEKKKAVAK